MKKLNEVRRLLVVFGCLPGLLLAYATAGAAESSIKPQDLYLVTVGITNAQGQRPLQATKKDALDMERWALGQTGRLFHRVHVKALTENQGTRANILHSLRALKGKATKGDYTMLYMSAHGGKQSITNEYSFAAFDGAVSWTDIHDAIRTLPGTKIVILDTCHAGAIFRSDNVIVYSACLADQASADGASPTGNSVFTKYLLEALHGQADLNKNGQVSLAEMTAYVSGKLEGSNATQSSTLYRPENIPDALPLAMVQNVNAPVAVNLLPAPAPQGNAGQRPVLAGAKFLGHEGQGSFLSFEFTNDGKVIMVDGITTLEDGVTPRRVHGSWTMQGDKVTIAFRNCVYHGKLTGNQLAGHATMNQSAWNFSVSRK